ncbi:MAG: RhuM family protein [Oribacterium sp.]|nr:RhuM family protein [Oribacterium sp.]MDY6316288.1 RhuM family protein [Oribacterium sp.]
MLKRFTLIWTGLRNIFDDGELNEEVVISKMEITTQHGAIEGKTQTKESNFYNLDAIISVGYRVNSKKATQVRQRLKLSIVKPIIRKNIWALQPGRMPPTVGF